MSVRRIAALAALLVTLLVVGATTASASPAPAVPQDCFTGTSPDGRQAFGACFASAPGSQFRLLVTTCGPSYCVKVRGPWWPQDGQSRAWGPGGFIARIDAVEFR